MMDGYSAVDQIIEEIEHVGGNLRKIIDVWEDLQKRSQSADSSRQGTPSSDDAVDESAGTHLVELPFATDAVADVNSDVYRDAMDGFLTQQPNYVSKTMQLNNYQILGVNWMLLLYRKGLSGILADEMGLGKTAQVISFLGRLYEMGEKGPHLVIVPASTIENWMREFQRFCPKLHVVGYYGTQAERVYLRDDLLESRDYQVVVTTYTMATGAREDRSFLRRLGCKSMILDEGHMIKNCTSSRYTHLMSLRTPFRLLLTGTPLQNNLQELVSLLTFIMPDMFLGNEEEIRKIFKIKAMATTSSRQRHDSKHSDTGNIAQVLSRQRIARAKKMMTPFVLRRRKADVLKHLPQKFQVIERCPMTALQKEMYDRILKESQRSYKESLDAKADKAKAKAAAAAAKRATSSQFEKFSNIVIHLRKAADHPLLFRNLYTDSKIRTMAKKIMKEEQYWDANEEYIYEDMSVMSDFELQRLCKEHKSIQSYALNNEEWMDSGKVQKLKELLPDLIQKGSKVLLFSQFTRMLDILELVMDTLGMKYVRLDGETKVADRQPLIDEFNENDDIHVFLLSTKAGGFGINLTSANVVILYDMDFNPQNDKQAEDRAHRVGQTRDVTVIKLIADRTIEDAILKMAEIKLRLDRSVSGLGDDDEDEDERKESVHTLLKSALLTSA
ncbi:SNF2 family N-terminal domain-containing protein [Radiomyces spectabilis]|uniref:SNF2 family N-terminal domain-containing protein n=1 Tax=Radiomyces spectabilis TaxID=64574 RepID=UPI002221246E|nr:SNF2 family N-terminal domain-containing protein [Radiomyces spectabilis]KAI8376297.1 SNF2 family N-terminal domain-containing protein [Radiomyces spectabilis]